MAGNTAFCFDRRMLKGKGAGFVCMAIEAELVLRRGRAQLMCQKTAMRIMAIAASDQTFIHFVMKGFAEIRFGVKMARIAKLRLRRLEQFYLHLGRMNGMAVRAAYIVFY